MIVCRCTHLLSNPWSELKLKHFQVAIGFAFVVEIFQEILEAGFRVPETSFDLLKDSGMQPTGSETVRREVGISKFVIIFKDHPGKDFRIVVHSKSDMAVYLMNVIRHIQHKGCPHFQVCTWHSLMLDCASSNCMVIISPFLVLVFSWTVQGLINEEDRAHVTSFVVLKSHQRPCTWRRDPPSDFRHRREWNSHWQYPPQGCPH